jgi:endo-1,4-beta-xylanase
MLRTEGVTGRRCRSFAATRMTGTALAAAMLGLMGACGGGGAEPTAPVVPVIPVTPTTTTYTPLRSIAESRKLHVAVGTALGSYFGRTDANGVLFTATAAKEFNVIVPENELKFDYIRPARATFRYTRPDSMLDFAVANGMKMRGHTLLFGSQLPAWLTAGSWTAADGRTLIDEHITGVLSHYKGKLAAWDVVNEAFNDDGTRKPTFWQNLVGPAYIVQAFRTARAADPNAQLFYNDYNIETINAKSDAVLAMVQDFKARGIPIDGIGFQSHFIVGASPSYSQLVANFQRFAALGLRIHLTELDVRMTLPGTAALLATQATTYSDTFKACIDTPNCDMVVMWGFTDLSSWIPGTFSGQGAALLFDDSFRPKPAYVSVNDLLGRS